MGGIETEDLACGKLFPTCMTLSIFTYEINQVWKNPVTGDLHFQVHPCGAAELLVDPLPAGAKREGALYPDGAHLTDLKEVRELLYKMQRPAIAPEVRILLLNIDSVAENGRAACISSRLVRPCFFILGRVLMVL